MAPSRYNLDPAATALMVCDVQPYYQKRVKHYDSVVSANKDLLEAAEHLSIDTYVSGHDPSFFGDIDKAITDFSAGRRRGSGLENNGVFHTYNKSKYSMITDDIAAKLEASGVSMILLTGLELHVCIVQTAEDLLNKGYKVFVATDASASVLDKEAQMALGYLKQLGVYLVTSEMALFMMTRDDEHPQSSTIYSIFSRRRNN
ncbi:Isochorismatase hydrolase [Ramicandelaber brevisporus]|nr:Isochorismatase hydrolase [Ramicandelaber brevisporus]